MFEKYFSYIRKLIRSTTLCSSYIYRLSRTRKIEIYKNRIEKYLAVSDEYRLKCYRANPIVDDSITSHQMLTLKRFIGFSSSIVMGYLENAYKEIFENDCSEELIHIQLLIAMSITLEHLLRIRSAIAIHRDYLQYSYQSTGWFLGSNTVEKSMYSLDRTEFTHYLDELNTIGDFPLINIVSERSKLIIPIVPYFLICRLIHLIHTEYANNIYLFSISEYENFEYTGKQISDCNELVKEVDTKQEFEPWEGILNYTTIWKILFEIVTKNRGIIFLNEKSKKVNIFLRLNENAV